MEDKVILEKRAKEFVDKTSTPPFLYEIPVEIARQKLEDLQSEPVYKFPANVLKVNFKTTEYGCINVYLIIPVNKIKINKVIFYTHGAGWVYGSFHTHEKLVRELCARTNSIVVFPEYTRSPEAKYPIAIEECYEVLCAIPALLRFANINIYNYELIVCGDSVGGNMATVMSILSKYRNGPKISKQLLYYPVTNDDFNTKSYNKFSEGYYLSKKSMEYFWNQYAPNKSDRNNITASPLKATIKNLKGLPNTMIINGEADVLRSEGYDYAGKLMEAGVSVTQIQFKGMIHDFVMLNSLDQSNACRSAMNVSVDWINQNQNIGF